MSEKIQKLLDEIEQLTLLEASELVKGLEERFGVSAAAAAPVAVAGPAGPAAEEVEEQTEFSVILTGFGDGKKINTIKVVREVTSLGLKEAKDLVDSAPKPVREGIPKDEAEALKKKFEEAGAAVELK